MPLPPALPKVQPRELGLDVFPRAVRPRWLYRRYYGRGIDLAAIENALRGAEVGLMADLTDLSMEARASCPQLASTLQQRINPILAARRIVKPATGFDIDKTKAKNAALSMAAALLRIPRMKAAIRRMAWALYHGRSASEMHWETLATPIGIAPFKIRILPTELRGIPPRHLSFGTERDLKIIDPTQMRGYFQDDGLSCDDYPGKFLTWMPELWGETREREGLAPPAMYWAFFKRFSWRMRMMLTELWGIPWRIITADKDAVVGDGELDDAAEQAEKLGAETTAKISPGIRLDVVTPGQNSGELFSMNADDIDKQISKLVLTTSATTDAQPTGLGSNTTSELRSEKTLVVETDADAVGEELTEQLAYWIAFVNWGTEASALYTPDVMLDASPPKDRAKELDIVDKARAMSIPVSIATAREIANLPEPEPEDELLPFPAAVGAPKPSGAAQGDELEPTPNAKGEGAKVDDPNAPTAPAVGAVPVEPLATVPKLDITPSDRALYVTVDEARRSDGLPPIGGEDGSLTIAAFKAKYSSTIAEGAKAEQGAGASSGDAKPPPKGKSAPEGLDDGKPKPPPPPPPKEDEPKKATRGSFAGFESEEDCVSHLMTTEGMTREAAVETTRRIRETAGEGDPEACRGCGRPHHRFGGW